MRARTFRLILYATLLALCMLQQAALAATGTGTKPVFQIQRVYLKQLSLEQPNSPAVFLEQEPPQVTVALDIGATKLASGLYETSVDITATLKVKDKTALIVKARQAGIFTVENVPESQLPQLLAIGCSNIVYPYLRANVADAITRAGFPPVHLAEVNWETFYKNREKAKK
jgi:preprotein translocase subunit SecB